MRCALSLPSDREPTLFERIKACEKRGVLDRALASEVRRLRITANDVLHLAVGTEGMGAKEVLALLGRVLHRLYFVVTVR